MQKEKEFPEVKISLAYASFSSIHPSLSTISSSSFFQNAPQTGNAFQNFDAQVISAPHFSDAHEIVLPIEIFCNNVLSSLEIISKYLIENEHLNVAEIAIMLNRSYKTVWGAYQSAKQKMAEKIIDCPHDDSRVLVPIVIFVDRYLGMFESLVYFLKESYHLRYCQISRLVLRDQRTIWVTYDRVRKKKNNHEHK